jgi:hypothetical protein
MKKALLSLALLGTSGLGASGIAHADVTWEHRGTLKLGTTPLAYFSMKNAWSGQKHHTSVVVDATKIASELGMADMASAAMGNLGASGKPKQVRGEFQVIERLDDDRIIMSSPGIKSYIDEPYKNLKGRLRLNFWEALGSDLSAEEVPELTPQQRARLGQEMRAVISPLTRKLTRTYFRALPEKRTISGMSSHGYRFTSMVNVSPEKSQGEWVRTVAEWWLADEVASDDEIRAFTQSANEIHKAGGGPTASMWLNEQMPVMWEAMPVEAHQALATLIGAPGSSKYGFQGTPMQLFVTVSPPPVAQMAIGGDVRFSVVLSKRDTSSIDSAAFEAPTGSERIEVEPFLGMARNLMKMGKGELDKLLK